MAARLEQLLLAPSAHVARAAAAYLTHLLESNSHRVENDFRDRTRESRRQLEGQIRARLANARRSAERAVAVAVDKQHMSEADLEGRTAPPRGASERGADAHSMNLAAVADPHS